MNNERIEVLQNIKAREKSLYEHYHAQRVERAQLLKFQLAAWDLHELIMAEHRIARAA